MAISGSGGAYYRGASSIPSSVALHAVYTRHAFIKSSVAPGTSNFRTACELVGSVNITGQTQRPHIQTHWNHTTNGFQGSNSHRNSSGAYAAAQMTLANLTANVWHSIGATFDGSTLRSYLNGAIDGSAAIAAGHNNPVYVDAFASINSDGSLAAASQFAEGTIAELAVWNATLTASEMSALAKGFRASRVRPQSLVFYAPLIRQLGEIRNGRALVKQAGADVFVDHPRVIG